MKKTRFVLLLIFLQVLMAFPQQGFAQSAVIDRVVAVVGNSAILKSDIEEQQFQLQAQGIDLGEDPFCVLLDDMMFQKLLYNQAVVDSIEITPTQVQQEIERRLRFFIQQIGSRERLEEYYGKTLNELREEFFEPIREQALSQRMEAQITQHVKITPSEVQAFFRSLPEGDIPMVESELSLAQIVIEPPIDAAEVEAIKDRLDGFRQRILEGENFRTLAIMYSEDPGSARNGGELGFYSRGELYPEFEAVAFGLRPGEISEIVETQAGYHILQLIARRGEQVNVRHILLQPKISVAQEEEAINKLDSIRGLIIGGEMTFAEAARMFSTHRSGFNGGVMVNPYTGTSRFRTEELDPSLFFSVDRLEIGAVSQPMPATTDDGKQAFKIVTLLDRIEPHQANLEQDYDFIQKLALEEKKIRVVREWIERRLESMYVFVHDDYHHCSFENSWVK